MYTVYALRSLVRKYIYIGMTNNLNRRLREHQSGQNKTTAPYRPFELIYEQEFTSRVEARQREIYLKSGAGKEWLKNRNQ